MKMRNKLIILNSREIKEIRNIVIKQFGYFLEKNYVFLRNDKNKIFVVNKDLSKINLDNLIIERIGLYFAEFKPNQVRLSKEGAQLLYLEAKKNGQELNNVVDLSKEETKTYFLGVDLIKDLGTESRLIILKYNGQVLGCAKYKENKILNFLPKTHRGEVIL